jgi:hypothetical protein
MNWIKNDNDNLKETNGEVLAFHPEWIEDFNINGTRAGFMSGDGRFVSAKWNYQTNQYESDNEYIPTYFLNVPVTPFKMSLQAIQQSFLNQNQ